MARGVLLVLRVLLVALLNMGPKDLRESRELLGHGAFQDLGVHLAHWVPLVHLVCLGSRVRQVRRVHQVLLVPRAKKHNRSSRCRPESECMACRVLRESVVPPACPGSVEQMGPVALKGSGATQA